MTAGDDGRGAGRVPVPSVEAARRPPAPPEPRKRRVAPLAIGAALALAAGLGIGAAAVVALSSDPSPEPAQGPPVGPPDAGLDAGLDAGPPDPDAGSAIPLGAGEPEGPACPGLTGRWAGRWSATTSRGTWTAEFTRARGDDGAPELHGDIAVVGTACGRGGHIVGRIREDCSVEFDPYSTGPCRVRYTATFDGDRMHGTLAATGFGMADSGRWSGSRRGATQRD